jgi:hypothetical protein
MTPHKEAPMKLNKLKDEVYSCWDTLHHVNRAVCVLSTPTEDEVFKAEIRHYGSLRCRDTWATAFAVLTAKFLFDANDDNQFLIEFHLIRAPKNEGWSDLVPQVIEQFIAIDGGLDCLLNGFEQIYHYGTGYDATPKEIKELTHATQKAAERRRLSSTAQPIWGNRLSSSEAAEEQRILAIAAG